MEAMHSSKMSFDVYRNQRRYNQEDYRRLMYIEINGVTTKKIMLIVLYE
jgi:hypothetical protein